MANTTGQEVENLRRIARAERFELQKALLFLSAKHADLVHAALADATGSKR